MHNSLDFTPGAFPGLPQELKAELTKLDCITQDHHQAVHTLADGIKRLSSDPVIAYLCDEIVMRAGDWGNCVNVLAEQCGANHRAE